VPGKAAKAAPSIAYAQGYFTQLIRDHNWPPGFEAQQIGRDLGAASRENAQRMREQGLGHSATPLNLPGAAEHVKRWAAGKS